ncbi:unnamed protein product [Leptosia nina]|uniref:Uncharacterized protein n=1 Tax=Leptosia nina TaxID=320188 RepID=A0AAV1JLL4_9NEOP
MRVEIIFRLGKFTELHTRQRRSIQLNTVYTSPTIGTDLLLGGTRKSIEETPLIARPNKTDKAHNAVAKKRDGRFSVPSATECVSGRVNDFGPVNSGYTCAGDAKSNTD